MNTCTKCKQTKPLDDFYQNRNSKSGYKARCKDCCEDDKELSKRPPKLNKKLSPDNEKAANAAALGKLVKKHPSEFFDILSRERAAVARRQGS